MKTKSQVLPQSVLQLSLWALALATPLLIIFIINNQQPALMLEGDNRARGIAFLMGSLVALIFWGSGALLLWRRVRHQGVVIYFLMSQIFAVAVLIMLSFPAEDRPRALEQLSIASFYLAAPLLLHHSLIFPRALGSTRQRLLILIPAYLLTFIVVLRLLFFDASNTRPGTLLTTLEISAALGFMLYSYRRATPDSRRRLRVILAGNLLAGIPSILFYLLPGILGLNFRLPMWIMGPFWAIAPLGYLYAIARHNLFGIDRLLNRALVYFLLSLAIFLLYLGPFTLLYRRLPQEPTLQMLLAVGLTLLIGFAFDWLRTRVQKVVDRIFYNGWYDYASVIETISDALARTLDRDSLRHVLTRQTPELMHLRPAQLIIGQSAEPPPNTSNLPATMQFKLRFQDDVQAIWAIDRRSDGDDLTAEDRRILTTLARQAEIVLSNVLLIETLQKQLQSLRTSQEMLRKTQQQLLRSREDERTRLARDLHDGPIQELVGLNLQLGLLLTADRDISADGRQMLRDMRHETKIMLQDMRRICTELRPQLLDALGLAAAIQALAEDWSQHHNIALQLQLPSQNLDALPDEVAVNLYRIVQESLSNIARHAKAQQVSISLERTDTGLQLSIQDDGQGFVAPESWHHLANDGHFGLVGIGERAQLIGGEWGVQTEPGQGTTIWVYWDAESWYRSTMLPQK